MITNALPPFFMVHSVLLPLMFAADNAVVAIRVYVQLLMYIGQSSDVQYCFMVISLKLSGILL